MEKLQKDSCALIDHTHWHWGAAEKRNTSEDSPLKMYFNHPSIYPPIKCFSSGFCVPGTALVVNRLKTKSDKGHEAKK